MGGQKQLRGGELEAAVMQVLWDAGGWSTPGDVHQVLTEARPLAYNTVLTILVRLWEKGRLERQRHGRAYAYRPVQTREQYAAARMEQVLHEARDRPAALATFLETLGEQDRAQLRRLLQQLSRRR
ncbi:MAG TPA: BlaI/MecI/CopY family transcriptional regulator [Acidimicrobiales bacterium]|nr:BlaI/MecI/CopY family transcriptional regulator [Acidimicrobiales bacterium]